ncbi:MAG: Sec-independent protein translocase protein TatC [Gemmatimonadota bacterium]|nr:MAG: Sec-independent protein translocase protein TatC [Gemmatimonadota bacterium]
MKDRPSELPEMGLFEHLAELRAVLLQSLVAAILASAAAWFVSERAVDVLIRPAAAAVGDLKFISPTGAFLLRFKTSVGLGLFAAAPFIMWRLWSFVVPGLLRQERKVLLPVIFVSIVLFYGGSAFSYLVILPVSLQFLVGFGTDLLQPMITAEHYFDFALRITLAFGIVFQFPLISTLLTYWGILPPDFLKRYWRYGVVLVFVLSAILTPPDLASQLLMAGPVLALYFVSLGLAQLIGRTRRKKKEDPESAE